MMDNMGYSAGLCRQALHHHPSSDWIWLKLGTELLEHDQLDEAETALSNARRLNSKTPSLWRSLATLHRKRKKHSQEIEALEHIRDLGEAQAHDLNRLGGAYRELKFYGKALECHRAAANLGLPTTSQLNLANVFAEPEVSQDVDASDACRRILALDPHHSLARLRLSLTKAKLLPLAKRAREAANALFSPEDQYNVYISPFDILQLDGGKDGAAFDIKSIQRARKRLLQEIDINDGKVAWLGEYALEKSRAIRLEQELHNDETRAYHRAIWQDKQLLRFLTHGDIEHFLYSDDYFPRATIELLERDPGFRTFISTPFARQYDCVLTAAIDQQLLPVIEVMFDGRQWVDPGDEDICFERAHKRIHAIVESLEHIADKAHLAKPSISTVEQFLAAEAVVGLFNLLPTAFRTEQSRLVGAIRSIAVTCNNEYSDADLAASVLNLCKRFHFKSVELSLMLEEDFKNIEQIIASAHPVDSVQVNQKRSLGNIIAWCFWIAVIVMLLTAWIIESQSASTAGRSKPSTTSVDSTARYRVSSSISQQLDRDAKAIGREEAKAEALQWQLENLGREVERERPYVDHTDAPSVDDFNDKVNAYNTLVEKVRAHNAVVNQMIDAYNAKLRKHGR